MGVPNAAKPETGSRAVGYLRVSAQSQVESGLGLEAQRAAIEAAAQRQGLTLGGVFTDAGVSGSLDADDREGLLAAIQQLRRGDVLLVAKRDRLGRDVIKVETIGRLIERKGARVVLALADEPSGRATTQVRRRCHRDTRESVPLDSRRQCLTRLRRAATCASLRPIERRVSGFVRGPGRLRRRSRFSVSASDPRLVTIQRRCSPLPADATTASARRAVLIAPRGARATTRPSRRRPRGTWAPAGMSPGRAM